MKDKIFTRLFRTIDDKIEQRLDEIFKTHPQLREMPEKVELRTKQNSENCEYSAEHSVWFDGEQIAKFTTSSKMKNYTEILIEVSEITYYK